MLDDPKEDVLQKVVGFHAGGDTPSQERSQWRRKGVPQRRRIGRSGSFDLFSGGFERILLHSSCDHLIPPLPSIQETPATGNGRKVRRRESVSGRRR